MKQKIGKMLVGFITTLTMVTGALPGVVPGTLNQVKAANQIGAGVLLVGGTDIFTADNKTVNGTTGTAVYSYEDGNNILTLTNFECSTSDTNMTKAIIRYDPGSTGAWNLTIRFSGTNTLSCTAQEGSTYGIVALGNNSHLTFEGDSNAVLNCSGGGKGLAVGGIYNNTANITFKSGKIVAQGVATLAGKAYGIYSGTHITVDGGHIEAIGGEGVNNAQGIYCGNTFTMNNGYVKAVGGSANPTSALNPATDADGIYGNFVYVYNGHIEATGGSGAYSSRGICSKGEMKFFKGYIEAVAGTGTNADAIGSLNNAKIKNSMKGMGWLKSDESVQTINENPTDGYEGNYFSSYKKVLFESHNHDFTYSGSGDKITATCNKSNCTLDDPLCLTIKKPTLTTYDGAGNANATLDNLESFKTETELSTITEDDIKYYKANKSGGSYTKTGNALTGAPSNAGDYVAELTISNVKTSETVTSGSVTAFVGYTIARKAADLLTPAQAQNGIHISYPNETVVTDDGLQVSSSRSSYEAVTSLKNILDNENEPKLYVRREESANCEAGEWVEVALVSRPDSPENISTENATTPVSKDGKITGADTSMQYKINDDSVTTWIDFTGSEALVRSGSYLVRKKATDSIPAGKSVVVTVGKDQSDINEIPKLLEITNNSIIIDTKDGYEYSIDGNNWQSTGNFEGLESGHEYTIQIRKNGKIVSTIVETTINSEKPVKIEIDEKLYTTLGNGAVKAESRVMEDSPVSSVGDFSEPFVEEVLEDADLDEVKNQGKDCLIYMEVTDEDDQTEKNDISEKVRESIPEAAFGMVFDISLWKRIGGSNPDKIFKRFRDNPVVIVMIIPSELKSKNRSFYIGCEHKDENGDTTEIEFINTDKIADGEQVKFSITGCSTYALYYKDEESSGDNGSTPNEGNNGNLGYVAKQRVDATQLMELPSGVKIKYISSDKKLATVNRKGVIRIKKNAGTVKITAKNRKTGATISSCTLVIEKPVITKNKIVVTGVDVGNPSSWKKLNAADFLKNTKITPKWYSSKPLVAEVDKDTGEVTIKKTGKAKIYAVFGAKSEYSKFGTRKTYKYTIVSKK